MLLYRPDGLVGEGLFPMVRASCRDLLLDAAESVVMDSGAAHLTLDAVAEKAGVSKGGLLYHFPTKEALLEAMVTRLLEQGDDRRAAALEGLPPGPARELKADLIMTFNKYCSDRRMTIGLLAAVANEPRMSKAVRERLRRKFDAHAAYNGSLERKILLMLAAHGLALNEMLQVSPFDDKERKALFDELMLMAEEVCQDS